MALNNDFLAEFPPVSKAEWLQQIVKDLKGRQLEELEWQAGDDLRVSPFAHADDFPAPPAPLSALPNNWEICEDVYATDPVEANRQVLDALEGGAEGLRFHLATQPDAAFFERLLDGVYLDFIGLHFAGPGVVQNPGNVLAHLERQANAKNIRPQNLRGSLGYDPARSDGIVDWRYLADLTAFAREQFPGFRLITVAPAATTAEMLKSGNQYLQKLNERGIAVADAALTMQFSVAVGKSYFLEIARIRAFRLLWLHVLKGWNAPLLPPVVDAHFLPEVYTDEINTNMIRATTMAMSAVLGGADRLTVLPCDAGRAAQTTYSPAFSRRIARNVQHLLKMESFLNEIPDPAAGSYYIEKLTLQLAERAWAAFQQA